MVGSMLCTKQDDDDVSAGCTVLKLTFKWERMNMGHVHSCLSHML